MPRRRSPTLTDGELRLMKVLWRIGQGTVTEVVVALSEPEKPAYNTVLTLLRILERKGYLSHDRVGRAFRFHPIVGERQVRRSAVKLLLLRFFEGSPSLLIAGLLEDQWLDAAAIEGLRTLIQRREGVPA